MKLQYIKLGTDSIKEERGFSGKGGGWDLFKMFYEGENGYGEFYFNINTQTGEAEIAAKDSGYGDSLLAALAKELK